MIAGRFHAPTRANAWAGAVCSAVVLVAGFCASVSSAAESRRYRVVEIVVRGAPRTQTDAAVVLRGGKQVELTTDLQVATGETIRVWVSGVRVRLRGPNGDTFAIEHGRDGPADHTVGDSDACRQRAGRVTYGIIERMKARFRCLIGRPDRSVPVGVEGTRFAIDVLDDGMDIVVADGVVTVGTPGTPLFRRITNGHRVEIHGTHLKASPVDRETVVRVRGALTEVTMREQEGRETRFVLQAGAALEERVVTEEVRRTTRSTYTSGLDASRIKDAVARYRAGGVQVVDTLDATALWALGDELFGKEDVAQAREMYLRAEKAGKFEGVKRAELAVNLALCDLELRRFEEAERGLLGAEPVLPRHAKLLAALVDLYQQRSWKPQLRKANQYLDRLLAVRTQSGHEALVAGRLALDLWRFAEARARFAEASGHFSATEDRHGEVSAWLGLGHALVDVEGYSAAHGHYRKALGLAEAMAKAHPDRVEAQLDLARALFGVAMVQGGLGQNQQALDTYARGIPIADRVAGDPKELPKLWKELAAALREQASLLWKCGKASESLAAVRRAAVLSERMATLAPEEVEAQLAHVQVLFSLGVDLLLHGQVAEAHDAFRKGRALGERLVARDPQHRRAQLALAQCVLMDATVLLSELQIPRAKEEAGKALAILERLAAGGSRQSSVQVFMALSLQLLAVITPGPSRRAERLEVLLRRLAIVERLAAEEPLRTDFQTMLASALDDVGDIEVQQNALPAALARYERAAAIRDRLVRAEPDRFDLQLELVDSAKKSGDALAAQRRKADAMATYQKGLALVDRLLERSPSDFLAKEKAVLLLLAIWELEAGSGPHSDAAYRRMLALESGDLSRMGAVVYLLGHFFNRAGNTFWERSQLQESRVAYQKSVGFRERLCAREPNNPSYARDLAFSCANLANAWKALGKLEATLAPARRALALREGLAMAEPQSLQAQSELGDSLEQLAGFLHGRADKVAALDHFRRGLAVRERGVGLAPKDADARQALGRSANLLGNFYWDHKQYQESVDAYQQAVVAHRRLALDMPAHVANLRDLAVVLGNLAGAHEALGKSETAIETRRQAFAAWEQLARADPSADDARKGLAEALIKIGDLLAKQGKVAEAVALLERAAAVQDERARAKPKHAETQRDYLISLLMLGWTWEPTRTDEALAAYRRVIDAARRTRPNSEAAADLAESMAWFRSGDILQGLGRTAEALAAYQQLLAVRERQVRAQPTDATRREEARLARLRIAECQDEAAGRETLGPVLAALDQLERDGRATSTDRDHAAWCLLLLRRFAEAEARLAATLTKMPATGADRPFVVGKLATARLLLGKDNEALTLYAQIAAHPAAKKAELRRLGVLRRRGMPAAGFDRAEAVLRGPAATR